MNLHEYSSNLSDDSDSGSKKSEDRDMGAIPFKKRKIARKMYQEISITENKSEISQDTLVDKAPIEKPKMYSNFAEQMMAKMGHVEGTGLGKNKQGITAPIETSLQKGRRGLGLKLNHFEPANDTEWIPEEVITQESIDWMPICSRPIPTLEEMKKWIVTGHKKLTIDDEDTFCDRNIVEDVLKCKSIFDELEGEEMRRARTRSNPYETIRGVFFQNRAAMKMANMDAVADFMFTSPKDAQGRPLVSHHELFYFADICAGPGGFSEYVLWRKKLDAKGFGFTLKGGNDFKLEEFLAAPSELFEPHYGVGGYEGDGDIYRPDNLKEFRQFVHDNTDGKGVHVVMADGGFSVEGQENIQEILSKRLYLCQFLCALSILRPGGNFVCKLFDLFTEFSVGLVYLMYHIFDVISIYKPITSRPANSERYIICKSLKPGFKAVHDYMFEINLTLDKFSGVTCQDDVTSVVPLDIIQNDEQFLDYIIKSNESIGEKQVVNLLKIQAFTKNMDLYETRQSEVREECLRLWQIRDEIRKSRKKADVQIKFDDLLENETDTSYFDPEHMIPLTENILETIRSVYDYRCLVSGNKERMYLLGLGRTHIFKWNGQSGARWRKLDDVKLELPSDTLIEVEIVQELRGEGRGQRKVKAVHITDILFLYGEDIRKCHFNERMAKAKKFVKAIFKASRPDLAPLRVKDVYRLEEIGHVFDKLKLRSVKGSMQPKICYSCDNDRHYQPAGLIFIKTIEEPWTMAFSRSQQKKYFYNKNTQESKFEVPPSSIAFIESCWKNRMYWEWGQGVKLLDSTNIDEDNTKLSKDVLLNFVRQKLPR